MIVEIVNHRGERVTESLTDTLRRTGATLELSVDPATGPRAVARTRLPSGSTDREVESRHDNVIVAAVDAARALEEWNAREPSSSGTRPFRWVVEVEVDADLVADGLTMEDAEHALHRAYPLARMSGLRARVVEAPGPDAVARAQGYQDATAKRHHTRTRP